MADNKRIVRAYLEEAWVITLTGISIVRVADGKLVEHWGERDTAGLMQQLPG